MFHKLQKVRELRRTLEHAKTAKDELQQKLGEMALRERLQLQADEELKRTNAAMANQLSEAKHKTTNLKSKNKELQAQVSPASLVDPIPPNAVNSSAAILGPRDFGPRDFGPRDFGPRDFGPRDFGPRDFGPRDFGPRDFGPRDFGPRDFGPRDFGPRDSNGRRWPVAFQRPLMSIAIPIRHPLTLDSLRTVAVIGGRAVA